MRSARSLAVVAMALARRCLARRACRRAAGAPPRAGRRRHAAPTRAHAGARPRPRRSCAPHAAPRTDHRSGRRRALTHHRSPAHVAELEAGIIALPTAPISAGQSGGDTPFGTIGRGDATLQTGLHVLYRWNRDFAAGAGVLFAPFPTSDPEYGGLRALPRTHSRSYFFIGGEGRYIPLHYRFLEAWVGVSVGGVVIADRFTTNAGDEVAPILGTKEVTVRTEGFAFGAPARRQLLPQRELDRRRQLPRLPLDPPRDAALLVDRRLRDA